MDAVRLLSGTPKLAPGQVSLTFDDGPGPRTVELTELLAERDVPATFFLLGESIERYGHLLGTYRATGQAIGLHGERHRPFSSVARALDQLARCRARLPGHLTEPVWFRPPYGIADLAVPGYAGPVGWHAHGSDWDVTYRRGQTVAGCVDAIVGALTRSDGGIVLLHDYAPASEFTAAGLTEAELDLRITEITELLIGRLRADGFDLTGLPEPVGTRSENPG
ncbi:MAG TPA: polysaccharide deacetylase family protein [Jatrophihabitans sp.]|nr:polysaccharide deacetylase family protein [Jatrophihabitans sp.]